MASFDVAKLLNKITQDIPGIKTVLTALAKWDLSALTDVPDGAMQATTDSSNRLTIKKKVSGSYAPVAKIMHDVDTVDGYHASESATANALAVRNAAGALPGNVLGNAATADTATALAAGSVVPVNKGGTGATTASGARSNLGIAGSADFTAHVATAASPTVTGHVALDALAANGTATAAPGGYGWGTEGGKASQDDYNACIKTGYYSMRNTAVNGPSGIGSWALLEVNSHSTLVKTQIARVDNTSGLVFYRKMRGGIWSDWEPMPIGITDSVSTVSSYVAASATAVKTVNDSAVHNTGDETIEGKKTFAQYALFASPSNEKLRLVNNSAILGTAPAANLYWQILMRDSASTVAGSVECSQNTSNVMTTKVRAMNRNTSGDAIYSDLGMVAQPDGVCYGYCPTPPDNANSTQIATAAWVRSHSNAEQIGDVFASFAASRAGCLLMNGAAVSRTTYANLFALIGTAFGEGDGSTTFNLPKARDRVLQGANSNLMQYLAAGLPNITGTLVNLNNQSTSAGGTGSGAFLETACVSGVTEGGGNKSYRSYSLDASRSSSKYGASTTVQSAAITVNFFIKY